ncbi:MAG TPA: ABC exporter membrane fusion protein [Coleofasciculaceae cyanobacterium]
MGHKPTPDDPLFSKPIAPWATPKTVRLVSITLGVVGILATGVAAIYSIERVSERPTEPILAPSEPPVTQGVTALGRIEPQGEVRKLSAPSSSSFQGARVEQLLVSQGDLVRTNQVIAVMDNRDRLQAALERAKKQVSVSQANLEKVQAGAQVGAIAAQEATIKRVEAQLKGEQDAQDTTVVRLESQLKEAQLAKNAIIRRLEAELRTVQTDYERYQKLAQDGAIPASELDNRRLRVETVTEQLSEAQANRNETLTTLNEQLKEAKVNRSKTTDVLAAQINEEKAKLEQIKEIRPVDIQQAKAEVESAIATVGEAQADLELAYVRSPVAGRILKINTRPGETIDDKEGIAELGQTDEMIVIAEIYESDISKVRVGQRVAITSESKAFKEELRGSVSQIGLKIGKKDVLSTDPAAANDARVIEVNIRLNPEDSKRVAGLTYSKVIVEIFL